MIERLRLGLTQRFGRDSRYGKVTWEAINSYYGINIDHNRQSGILSLNLIGKINTFFTDHPWLIFRRIEINTQVLNSIRKSGPFKIRE